MENIKAFFRGKKQFVYLSALWGSLWIVPWGMFTITENLLLKVFVDMGKLGIALLVFMVPGAMLYMILRQSSEQRVKLLDLIPIGFVFSTLIIGLIGLTGRLLGFSFELVKLFFAFTGFVELIILMKLRSLLFYRSTNLYRELRESLNNPPLLAALFLGVILLLNTALFFIDDWTYLAYITNWQHSAHLNFSEVIFGTNSTDPSRFWLTLYPMGQALISDLSGIPGILLLGHYLEIYLVMISILAMYYFARVLGLSRRSAGFSVLIHISLLSWIVGSHNPVGFWFLLHMAEDKVSATFIIAPVLFSFLSNFINRPRKQNYLLFLLAGISLTITHPVTLFYVVCIVFGVTIVSWLMSRITRSNVIIIIVAAMIWVIPYVMVRFSNHPSMANIPYDAEQAKDTLTVDMLLDIRSDGLYGMDPEVLMFADADVSPDIIMEYQLFRLTPIIISIAAGLIGLVMIRHQNLYLNMYLYILISVTLILFSLIPHTGRLLGYLVSARMLFRASWFAPLGLGVIVILDACLNFFSTHISPALERYKCRWLEKTRAGLSLRLPMLGLVFFFVFSLASPTMLFVINYASDLVPVWSFNKQLADVGEYISNNNTEKVAVITLNNTDNYLPGISAKAVPISFREEARFVIHYFFSDQELDERKNESNIIRSLDTSVSICDRISLIKKYQIRYISADVGQADQFVNIMSYNGKLIEIVFTTDEFVLFEVTNDAIGKCND